MVYNNICPLMLWMKVASAMEELKIILSFLQMDPLWSNLVFESANRYSFKPFMNLAKMSVLGPGHQSSLCINVLCVIRQGPLV